MAEFPKLKTNAVAQYPSTKTFEFKTEILKFVDGKEQRFRRAPSMLQRWMISLDLLDDGEADAVQQFVTDHAGRFGQFSFYDPWDNVLYEGCSFDQDEISINSNGAMNNRASLVIRRNA